MIQYNTNGQAIVSLATIYKSSRLLSIMHHTPLVRIGSSPTMMMTNKMQHGGYWLSRRTLLVLFMTTYLLWMVTVHQTAMELTEPVTAVAATATATTTTTSATTMLNVEPYSPSNDIINNNNNNNNNELLELHLPTAMTHHLRRGGGTAATSTVDTAPESDTKNVVEMETPVLHTAEHDTKAERLDSMTTEDNATTTFQEEPSTAVRIEEDSDSTSIIMETNSSISNGAPLFASNDATLKEFVSTLVNAPECHSLQADDVSMTLVTQCDDERVPMIAQHCLRWKGPLSVAVFSSRSPADIVEELVELGCRQEQLLVDTLVPSETYAKDSYPINHLRNMAIEHADTTHIAYMDIDFLPSNTVETTLQSEHIRQALAHDHKHALVIPAFEYKPKCQNCSLPEELLRQMPRSKDELMRLHDRGEASMFHDYWPVAHDSTDYDAWKEQELGSLVDISCIKSRHYEPYLILRKCQELPPFQEAFKGYGYNKASFTMQLQAMQYRFSQVGGAFYTHFPHPTSKARVEFDKNKYGANGQRLQREALVQRFVSWLDATYGQDGLPLVPYCGDKKAVPQETPDQATQIPFQEHSEELRVCVDVTAGEITYSIVTQCSDDRLWMMEHHCQRWSVNNTSPSISLVVYTNETLKEVKDKLHNMKCPVDSGLTVQVFPQIYEDRDYPVNQFRNDALAAVTTTHAVFLDIDFWESTDLFTVLNTFSVRSKLAESTKHSVIVPAFQLLSQCDNEDEECPEQDIPLMPHTRSKTMISSIDKGDITAFNLKYNPDGHGSTRYDVWMEQEEGEQLLELDCVTSNRYEPYLVVRVCHDLPPFQPVFTGYGKNKISWILHLRQLGWSFFQLGQAFVIHYPHLESTAKQAWKEKSRDKSGKMVVPLDSIRVKNDMRFVAFREWLASSVPNYEKVAKCLDNGASTDDDTHLKTG